MPNHITNRLKIIGNEKQVKKVKEHIKIEEENSGNRDIYGIGTIDFNKIISIPQDLHFGEVDMRIETMAKAALQEEYDDNPLLAALEANNRAYSESPLSLDDEKWDVFIKLLQNKRRYGAYYWYDWRQENWGTKWNAYGQPDNRSKDNIIYFQTAWNCPQKIIKELSCKYPELEFEIAWADEDIGNNVGVVKYKNGKIVNKNIPENRSDKAYELFFEITKDTLKEHHMNENYEYIGE